MTLRQLKAEHDSFRLANPGVRIREAANALSVSEAALVAADGARRLSDSWKPLLQELASLGSVMALTRNDACVHEKHGVYSTIRMFKSHGMGLVLDKNIDLRLFMRHWHFGYAVEPRHSLQFFDESGTAVHKVFLTRKSDVNAYHRLVQSYGDDSPAALPDVRPYATEPSNRNIEPDASSLLAEWSALEDSHDFFPMLQRHGAARLQALRLAEGTFTEQVSCQSARHLLTQVGQHSIMIFVGNRGCLQIHTGSIRKVKPHGRWFNVLDPGFSLHLDESKIVSSWIVRKPSRSGIITSLEVFDAREDLIVQFFEERKPGFRETAAWQQLMKALPRAEAM